MLNINIWSQINQTVVCALVNELNLGCYQTLHSDIVLLGSRTQLDNDVLIHCIQLGRLDDRLDQHLFFLCRQELPNSQTGLGFQTNLNLLIKQLEVVPLDYVITHQLDSLPLVTQTKIHNSLTNL